MEWQPIETAPVGLSLFFDEHAKDLRRSWFVGWNHANNETGCVTTTERAQQPATHWLPLPPAPTVSK